MSAQDDLTAVIAGLQDIIDRADAVRKQAPHSHADSMRAVRASIDALTRAARVARDEAAAEWRRLAKADRAQPAVTHYARSVTDERGVCGSKSPSRTTERDDVTCMVCRRSYAFREVSPGAAARASKQASKFTLRLEDMIEAVEAQLDICTESLERRGDGWSVIGADGEYPIPGTTRGDKPRRALYLLGKELGIVERVGYRWRIKAGANR